MKMSVWSLELARQSVLVIDITVKNIHQSFTHKVAAKASWLWNYVTVTLCISVPSIDSPLSLSLIPPLFNSRLKTLPFLQILPTVAFLFFSSSDSTDSPDCLEFTDSTEYRPIRFFSFCVFHFLVNLLVPCSVKINGEDLSCYSNKIGPVSLRKCPYDHWLTNKAYLSAIRVTNISRQSFTHKMAAKINWHRYGTKLRHCVYIEWQQGGGRG